MERENSFSVPSSFFRRRRVAVATLKAAAARKNRRKDRKKEADLIARGQRNYSLSPQLDLGRKSNIKKPNKNRKIKNKNRKTKIKTKIAINALTTTRIFELIVHLGHSS